MGVLRLSHVDVQVTDLDLATAYYTEVIGLLETERTEDAVFLKCWDEPNHHSLRLTYGPRVGMDRMSFMVERESDLGMFENRIQAWGYPVQRISKGEALDEVVVTNTIPLSDAAQGCAKIRQLSVAPLIAETVQRIASGESVMSLFSDQNQLF